MFRQLILHWAYKTAGSTLDRPSTGNNPGLHTKTPSGLLGIF